MKPLRRELSRIFLIFGCFAVLFPCLVHAQCVTAPSGLVGWWRGEGNANDSAGANNGSLSPSGASYANGEVGQGFSFDGTNGFAQIPDSATLKPANVTVEAWVWLDPSHPAGQGGEQIVFKKNTWSAWFEGYSLLKVTIDNGDGTSSDRFQFCVSRYGDQVAINSQTIAQRGVWYHVAATYDGNQSVLYINGVAEASATPGFALDYDTTPVYIGTSGTWAPYLSMFAGIIDEASIYNRALSPNEIRSIYLAGSFGKCPLGPPPPPPPATNCTPAASGLVGWWKGEGNANDSAGANNGSLSSSGASYIDGKVGQGFMFDGTNGYVQVPDAAALKPTNVTVEAWVWLDPSLPSGRGHEQIVFKKNPQSAWFEGYDLKKATLEDATHSDHFQFVVSRGSDQVIINSKTIAQRGVWYHVAATYDGSQSVLYVNGVAEASATAGFALDYDTTPLYIGTTGTWAPYLNMFGGTIDEVSIYDRALSPSELQSIYLAGSSGKCPVGVPPTIVTQPVSTTNLVGDTVSFNVAATGTQPLSYQWIFSGANLNGATSSNLTLSNVQLSQAGNYSVVVTNLYGVATSSVASLTVDLPPPPPPATNCTPTPSGLVGWWRGEGNANDSAGANNGSLSPSGASYTDGKVGQGFWFDGANGFVQIPDAAALKPANVSVEAWVWLDPSHPAGQGGEQIVFKKNTWSAWFEGYSLLKVTIDNRNGTSSDRFQFCVSRYGNQVAINSKTIAQRGVWYHVAATYDGNQSILYVNGVAEASATPGFALDYDTTPVYIGTSGTWAPYLSMFAGIIDEVSIYNRALSPSEIQSIYFADSFGKCPPGSPPIIMTQPVSTTNVVGDTVSFNVAAAGTQPLSYQWRFNGANLNGATSSNLTLLNVQLSQGGNYTVLVTNLYGAATSSIASLIVNLPPPPPATNCTPASSGLVAWWHAEGNANDSAGANNGALSASGASYTNGEVGQGFWFDGTNGFVQIPDAAALKPANVTVEAWVWLDPSHPAGQGGEQIVFKKNTWDAWFEGYSLLKVTIDNGDGTSFDRFQFCVSRDGDQVAINSQTIVQRGVWYHVAATYDSNRSVLYVDGVAEASATPGFTLDYDTTPIYIGTSGTWAPYLSMFAGIIDEVSIYNRALSPDEIQSVYLAGSFGKCPPPVADATATTPIVISANGSNAAVVLDGSRSHDFDGNPLQYSWFDVSNNPLATGVVADVTLPVGTNSITLTVSDGPLSGSQTITVAVLTLSQAVDQLVATVDQNAAGQQSLIASLRAALASINRSNPTPAINQLQAFQNKVNAQLGPIDPVLAQELINEAQSIINAIIGGGGGKAMVNAKADRANGKLHLNFAGASGQSYIIEASTDMVHWQPIGVATNQGNGNFQFDDSQMGQNAGRFYRVVLP